VRESELANLLIQMGVDRGLDVERAADELASTSLPSFVDVRTFRASLLESVESEMRKQMEQRLQAMRQKFGTSSSYTPPAAPEQSPPAMASFGSSETPKVTPHIAEAYAADDGDVDTLDTIIGNLTQEDEPASDDTIVWSPRRD
jgi:hypothetical protein